MKRLTACIIALVLILALCASAMAEYIQMQGSWTLYTNKKKVKVYEEMSTKSHVRAKLAGATPVSVQGYTSDTNWFYVTFKNRDGSTWMGWILAADLTENFPQSLCTHQWSDWTVAVSPTCTEKGYRYRNCLICGIRDEGEIKKKGHDFDKWKVDKKATCSTKGERSRTCKVCGYVEREDYYEDHDYGSWSMTVEPTCTRTGERVRYCKVCGREDSKAIDKLPHDYAWTVTVEPTDHSAGVRSSICRVCGANGGEEQFDPEGTIRRGERSEGVRAMQQLLVEQGYLNAGGADGIFGGGTEKALMKYQQDRNLNPDGIGWPQTLADLQHDFGPWETVQEMTRAQAGERVRVCRGCGFEQRETIEPGEVFEYNRRGEDVRAMQQMLTEMGFNAGSYDGIYGKKLDAALASFAEANGFVSEKGKVRPADMDAVMNAWLKGLDEEEWKGEGNVTTPVNLALTVTQTGTPDDSGIHTYEWSLTNLGSEKAIFIALLLTFGDTPDFKQDNFVMDLDGFVLKPNAGNNISGSFNADQDWSEGNLNFAALAISEADGGKWLSNEIAFANSNSPEPKTIVSVAGTLDVSNIENAVLPVAFNQGDVANMASGVFFNAVQIYSLDCFDGSDVEAINPGDTIVISGQPVLVESAEWTEEGDVLIVNGGAEAGGFRLWVAPFANGYVVEQEDDLPTYTLQGVVNLTLDPSATFTDSWDIEAESATYGYDQIADAIRGSENSYFVPYNTTVNIVGNRITEITRTFVP